MVSNKDAAPRLSLVCAGSAAVSSFSCIWGLLTGASLPIVLASGLWGIPSILLYRHYRRSYGVGVGELVVAAGQLFDDIDQGLTDDKLPDLGPILVRRLRPVPTLAVPAVQSTEWITNQFWLSSTAYIGQPGTHKSVNLKHHVDQLVRLQGLDCIWGICDTHYDPDEEKGIDTWLPGIPRDQIPFRKTGADAFATLVGFYKEFLRRRDDSLKSENFTVLVIDEFQDTLPKNQLAAAIDMIGEIIRGGRKFNIRLLLGLHSPKKGENGIDSSVFWSMTSVVMGMTVADKTVQWPGDFKMNELLPELEAQLCSSDTARFTTAVVRPASNAELGFKAPQVKTLQNRVDHLGRLLFDEAPWIDQVRAKVDDAIATGAVTSFTGCCKLLGLDGSMRKDTKTGRYKDTRVLALFETFGSVFTEVSNG